MAHSAKRRRIDSSNSAGARDEFPVAPGTKRAAGKGVQVPTTSGSDASSENGEEEIEDPSPYSGLLTAFRVHERGYDASQRADLPTPNGKWPMTRPDLSSNAGAGALYDESQGDAAQDSDEENMRDAFETHFANPNDVQLAEKVKCIGSNNYRVSCTVSGLGKHTIKKPDWNSDREAKGDDEETGKFILKKRLQESSNESPANSTVLRSTLLPLFAAYRDILYCGRSVENAEALRSLACLHALNHIIKTRDRVIKNNARIARAKTGSGTEYRDQGFTRPKVLILLETRQSCARYLATITQLFEPEQQENRKRYEDAFVQTNNTISEDFPPDFRELFEGNNDNEFRMGLKLTRKTMKYYSQFYASDVIFASPLGLRRAIKAEDPKKSDHDFLSSIEILIIDQADAMLMQNWEHVEFVMSHLNLQPADAHGCDFSRVRSWYLDHNARHLRQTIVLSAHLTPELNGLFSSKMQNVAGKVKIVPEYDGTILHSGHSIRQTFSRFQTRSPTSDPDDRFKFFSTTVIPALNRQLPLSKDGLGALVFIPSYLDFVRVRNYFSTSQETQNLTFGSISEYTEKSDSRRARSHFFAGRQSVMLYTGRAHHFHRYRLRGVKLVVMYGLPENEKFYSELVGGFLGDAIAEGKIQAGESSLRVLFSKWDGLSLERIVGSKRVGKMIKDGGDDTFEFT